MALKKARTNFVCTECGGTALKWSGQCPHCKAWNTLQEFKVTQGAASRYGSERVAQGFVETTGTLQDLGDVTIEDTPRIVTGLSEFDRVMGGGLVPGGVSLIGGDPGIGKSTLLLQVVSRIVRMGRKALYVSGEESPSQIALRAKRLQLEPKGLQLMSEVQLEQIESVLNRVKPEFVVLDSIQTLFSGDLDSAPGSVSQVRECAARLTRTAKRLGITLFFVGHVTKDGALAGPRILEHIVDTVLYFEGDTHSNFRLIRAFKNRFGAVNELGVFAMTDHGLVGVTNDDRPRSRGGDEPFGHFPFRIQGERAREHRSRHAGRDAPAPRRNAGARRHESSAEPPASRRGRRRAAPRDASCGAAPPRGRRLL